MKVFWSWQSDTPGKTGRHFVRDCLQAAVDALNRERAELSELEESAERDAIQLDHDRKGVKGSPGLADTIYAKIREAAVVVCDVTPVAELVLDGGRIKKLTNPNVAIELGYAQGTRGDERVLMVLNLVRGRHEELAFDLRHKTGILVYTLADDADTSTKKAEAKRFTDLLVEALRPYAEEHIAPTEPPPQFVRTASTTDPARWWDPGAELYERPDCTSGASTLTGISGPAHNSLLYFRIIPREQTNRVPESDLERLARDMPLLIRLGTEGRNAARNAYGGISFADKRLDPGYDIIQGATQIFPSREIWAFDATIPRLASPGNFGRNREQPVLAAEDLESQLLDGMVGIVGAAAKHVGTPFPADIELGLSPALDLRLSTRDHSGHGRCYLKVIQCRALLDGAAPDAVAQAAVQLFSQFWESFGLERPADMPIGGYR